MTAAAFGAFAPFTLLGAVTIVVMLLIAVHRSHRLAGLSTIIGLLLCCIALPLAAPSSATQVTPLFIVDGTALFYSGLVLGSALIVAILSYAYLDGSTQGPREEYYLLLLTATLGAAVLPASVHFASFFLGLETLSISLLGLIAYASPREEAAEAGDEISHPRRRLLGLPAVRHGIDLCRSWNHVVRAHRRARPSWETRPISIASSASP